MGLFIGLYFFGLLKTSILGVEKQLAPGSDTSSKNRWNTGRTCGSGRGEERHPNVGVTLLSRATVGGVPPFFTSALELSYYIIPHHIIPYHIISYHIMSYHIISYHNIISYHIISNHII